MTSSKKNIWARFGSFVSKFWHSITDFFKPDNIEEVPVSSLSTYLREHLKFIENIISHYKPGQKGGISFDEPIQSEDVKEKKTSKSKVKAQEEKKTKTTTSGSMKPKIDDEDKQKSAKEKTDSEYGDLNKFTDILKRGNNEPER